MPPEAPTPAPDLTDLQLRLEQAVTQDLGQALHSVTAATGLSQQAAAHHTLTHALQRCRSLLDEIDQAAAQV